MSSQSNSDKGDFDADAVARYWFAEAEETLTVAGHLVEKRDYSYAFSSPISLLKRNSKGCTQAIGASMLLPSTTYCDWLKH